MGVFSTDLEPHTKLHNNLLNNFLCDICTRQKLLRYLQGIVQRVCPSAKKMGEWFEKEDKSWLKQNPSISGAHRISSGQNCFLGIGKCNNPREGLSTESWSGTGIFHIYYRVYIILYFQNRLVCAADQSFYSLKINVDMYRTIYSLAHNILTPLQLP